jgi:hypothetical protein
MPVPSPDEEGGGLGREYSTLRVKLTGAGAVQLGPPATWSRQKAAPSPCYSADGQSPTHSKLTDYKNTKRASRTDQKDDNLATTWFNGNWYMECKGNKGERI